MNTEKELESRGAERKPVLEVHNLKSYYESRDGDVRAVDVAIRRLREKVEDDPASPQFILTRRGQGYLFHGA